MNTNRFGTKGDAYGGTFFGKASGVIEAYAWFTNNLPKPYETSIASEMRSEDPGYAIVKNGVVVKDFKCGAEVVEAFTKIQYDVADHLSAYPNGPENTLDGAIRVALTKYLK